MKHELQGAFALTMIVCGLGCGVESAADAAADAAMDSAPPADSSPMDSASPPADSAAGDSATDASDTDAVAGDSATDAPDTDTDIGLPDSSTDSAPADTGLPDAGCLDDSECSGEVVGTWGACAVTWDCSGLGTRTRMSMRPRCLGGACVVRMETETESCPYDPEGTGCFDASAGGAGTCLGGSCCTGCVGASSCETGFELTTCGRDGAACRDCSATGEFCLSEPFGGLYGYCGT